MRTPNHHQWRKYDVPLYLHAVAGSRKALYLDLKSYLQQKF